MCIYICIHIYIFICNIYIYIHMCIYIHVYGYIDWQIRLCVYTHTCLCVCTHTRLCVYTHTYQSIDLSIDIYTSLYIYIMVYIFISIQKHIAGSRNRSHIRRALTYCAHLHGQVKLLKSHPNTKFTTLNDSRSDFWECIYIYMYMLTTCSID